MDTSIPSMIDSRYRVDREIGSGAMATVYSAEDTRLGRQVALKVLRPDQAANEEFRVRFQREAEAVASLNHPSIVGVYDTGTFPAQDAEGAVQVPYLVMELVRGKSLREILTDRGELPVDEAISYGSQILAALQYAGDAGIVHRDIKPANVMILPQTDEDAAKGEAGQVKVMDFGIARAMRESGESVTRSNTVMGTARYISPEQARGETVDSRSDIYSAACVIYEMLAGRSPFNASSNVEMAGMHLSDTPQPPSSFACQEIPRAVDTVLLKALSKNRADRFQSADAFRSALINAGRGIAPTSAQDDDATQPTSVLAGAAATGAAAGAAAGYTGSQQSVAPVEETGLGGFFDNAQAEYTDEELYDYERNEALAKKKRRRQAWTRVLTGMVIAALALFSIGTVLYYQNELNKVPTHAIPQLQGTSRQDAENTLRNLNIPVKWDSEYSDTVEKNNVIKTSPVTGTMVEEGQEVTVTVSDGPSKVKIPDNLAGQSESYVRSTLTEAGFKPGRTSTVNSATIPAGMVVKTNPESGQSADAGQTVDIVLSNGKVTVPDLRGMTRDQAIAALQAPEVMLSTNIETVETNSVPEGTVATQSAAAGTNIEQGSTVTIQIAQAAPTASNNDRNPGQSQPTQAPNQQDSQPQPNTQQPQQPTQSPEPSASAESQPTQAPERSQRPSAQPSKAPDSPKPSASRGNNN